MYIFTCENTFEDMMCCIYHAWEKALKVGHGCVRLEKRGEEQISLTFRIIAMFNCYSLKKDFPHICIFIIHIFCLCQN